MHVFTPVIAIPTLAMLYSWEYLALSRPIALQCSCDDHARYIRQALEQLAKALLGRVLVAAALHQNVEDVILLVDSAPQ